jgi:hypothetical protein
MVMGDPWVGLAEAVAGLRAELTAAIDEGAALGDRGVQFGLGPIELTVQAVLSRQANGKVGWKVLEVGGSAQSASTQTLKLVLEPVWKKADGTVLDKVRISDLEPDVPTSPTAEPAASRAELE